MGKVQGEGDYKSAKRFDDEEAAFVKSGRVEQAARDAEPKSQAEADAMKKAEDTGKSRSKGEDASLVKSTDAGGGVRTGATRPADKPSAASSREGKAKKNPAG